MKQLNTILLAAGLGVVAVQPAGAVPQSQVIIEARIADVRIADISTFGFPYDFSGENFITEVVIEQGPGGALQGNAFIQDIISLEDFVVPLEGQLRIVDEELTFRMAGSLRRPFVSVQIFGQGDALGMTGVGSISVFPHGRDEVKVDLVPTFSDYGLTLFLDQGSIVNSRNTVTSTGTAYLPGLLGTVHMATRQRQFGDFFEFTAISEDGEIFTSVAGIGNLPVISRLFRGTADVGTGLMVVVKPDIILTPDN